MDEWTRKIVVEPVERKIKALDFIDSVRKEIAKYDWTPLGDCPLIGKIPTTYIFDCMHNNIKNCNIKGTKCRRYK